MLTTLLAGACGGDGKDERSSDDRSGSSESTTTTQPPATAEEAQAVVEDLVREATTLADELFQDPAAVNDPDSPEIARLRELHTADSPTPDGVVEKLRELERNGQRVQAAPSGIFREIALHDWQAVDENTIRFQVCAVQDQETVDANGNVVERFAEVTQGAGEARRIDGAWRFYGLDRDEQQSTPIRPGNAQPGFCADLYDEEPAAS